MLKLWPLPKKVSVEASPTPMSPGNSQKDA
jgi:hypothetical protein